MKETYISAHISYTEATRSSYAKRHGIPNVPTKRQIGVMRALAEGLFEPIREHFNTPIYISSFFRGSELNEAIGGATYSDHMVRGSIAAIDIDQDAIGSSVTNADIFYYILENMDYHKLIWEFGDDNNPAWVHVSYSKLPEDNKRRITLIAERKSGRTHYRPFKKDF